MMSAFAKYALPLTLLVFVCAVPSVAGSIIGPRLEEALRNGTQESTLTVWIYFTDKGSRELQKSAVPSSVVTDQSLRRRAKVLPPERLTDYADLPVEDAYVAELGASGAAIQHRSKWFNAVSIRATARQIGTIASLPFVREIELVGRYKRSTPPPPDPKDVIETPVLPKSSGTHALDYGLSLNQLTQIQVPDLHDLGNNAQGVIVGVFDNGFRLPDHEALLAMNVIATYDFVDNKVSVVPNNTSPTFGSHGVNTLSTIGGFKEGQLIGPAYGASFILARTENDSSETPMEEDKWVRAIEWADSLGVQVTSTSLGYLDYNTGFPSWTWEDMDGRTTVITRAAAMAVRKGILVVNSAGNEGYDPTHNTLGAPADADSVLTVGAVTLSGKRTSFSSVGPTTASPPRVKPDVMALGTGVYYASSTQTEGYSSFGQGTSYACPLAAGVAALLVKARPDATPMEIVNAMRQTASQASAPDNLMGWGVVNALAAYNLLSGIDTVPIPPLPTTYVLTQNFPNPFNPGTRIFYGIPLASNVSITVHDLLGREVVTLERGFTLEGAYVTEWDGRDSRGIPVATGSYIYRLTAVRPDGAVTTISNRMMLIR